MIERRDLCIFVVTGTEIVTNMTKKVLIVDDNRDLRRILAKFLQSRGYETSEAASGREAIDAAIANKPNLILLDLNLSDMKGTDAVQAIRKHPRTAHVPIIGCSAYSETEFREEALRAGMVYYLQKPFSLARFMTVVEQLACSEP